MAISPLAGKPAPREMLVDLARLEREYYERRPDLGDPDPAGQLRHQRASRLVAARLVHRSPHSRHHPGHLRLPARSGHRWPALHGQGHARAVRAGPAHGARGAGGQRGRDDHPAARRRHADAGHLARHPRLQPRPQATHLADGIVITPSHNPPEDGGFKYNPPNGGPADTDVTRWVEDRANDVAAGTATPVSSGCRSRRRSRRRPRTQEDFVLPYVNDLRNVIDMEAIRAAGLKLAVDPLGGAAVHYWEPINEVYKLDIAVVNPKVDPTFSFMTVDHDGKIRMDCSSPYAMARLVGLKDRYRVAFANDPDSDRHGIVTPSAGLMNPNHYLAVAIRYLLTHRPHWPADAAVGKTLVSSSMIDRVVDKLGRRLCEVPVGFKWFVPGLFDGSCCFGGEESAGASFLRQDGTVWTTDKDGPIMDLLAAEITARTGKDPGEHYRELTAEFGTPLYTRIDATGHARAESEAGKAVARCRQGIDARRRTDHRQADQARRATTPPSAD